MGVAESDLLEKAAILAAGMSEFVTSHLKAVPDARRFPFQLMLEVTASTHSQMTWSHCQSLSFGPLRLGPRSWTALRPAR